MTANDLSDLLRMALWTVTIVTAPSLLAAMAVGTIIAVLQALTQIQEATITFVPKIVAVLLALLASTTLIGSSIQLLADQCYGRIAEPTRERPPTEPTSDLLLGERKP